MAKELHAFNRISKIDLYFVDFLRKIAADICEEFQIEPPDIYLDQSYQNDTSGQYDYSDGSIKIQIKDWGNQITGQYYSLEYNIDTLAHELAHAKTHTEAGEDHESHGVTFQHWYYQIARYIKTNLL